MPNHDYYLAHKEQYETYRKYHRDYSKSYNKLHKEEISAKRKIYRETHKELIKERHRQWYEKNRDKDSLRHKIYYQTHKEKWKDKWKMWKYGNYQKMRSEALAILGGAKCVYCGCTIINALEINHKNGGGRAENNKKIYSTHTNSMKKIISGTRDISDLEVVCKPCNAWYEMKRKGLANWNFQNKKWEWIWCPTPS